MPGSPISDVPRRGMLAVRQAARRLRSSVGATLSDVTHCREGCGRERLPKERRSVVCCVPLDTPCCLCDTDLHLTHHTNSLDDATVRFFLERNLVAPTHGDVGDFSEAVVVSGSATPLHMLEVSWPGALVLVPFSVHRTHFPRELFHACAYHVFLAQDLTGLKLCAS